MGLSLTKGELLTKLMLGLVCKEDFLEGVEFIISGSVQLEDLLQALLGAGCCDGEASFSNGPRMKPAAHFFFSFSAASGAKCWKTSACFNRNCNLRRPLSAYNAHEKN